ncbi:MAG TPA: ABC transporter substrate-binding protein [Chloroflexota bacterium]|jgi:ABC-type Fe3+ transport system substrate-binding protein
MQNGLLVGASALVLVALVACAAPSAAPSGAARGAPATAAQPAPAHPPALQAVIDAARQEGVIDLVWGDTVIGGREGIDRLLEGLNRRYGLNLEARFTPGPSFPEMATRLGQEYQAGRRSTSDVFIGNDIHVNALMAIGAVEAIDWAAWSLNVRDPALVAPQGVAVTFQTWVPGITYNTARVAGDAVPRRLQDLLKPEFKGRVASTPYAGNFDRLSTPELWGKARTLDFATRFADQLGGLVRCNEISRIASGEFDAFAIDCNQSSALRFKAEGAPIEFTPAIDFPSVSEVYMAVPKHAAHPAAAKLWIDHALSREGQDVLYAMNYIDSHLVPGSQTAREVDKLRAGGAQLQVFNLARLQQSGEEAERAEVLDEIQRLFNKR